MMSFTSKTWKATYVNRISGDRGEHWLMTDTILSAQCEKLLHIYQSWECQCSPELSCFILDIASNLIPDGFTWSFILYYCIMGEETSQLHFSSLNPRGVESVKQTYSMEPHVEEFTDFTKCVHGFTANQEQWRTRESHFPQSTIHSGSRSMWSCPLDDVLDFLYNTGCFQCHLHRT